jgi:hypothetical protein
MKLSMAALLVGGLFLAAPAAAQQDPWMRQVRAQLVAVAESVGDEGMDIAGDPIGGSLNEGATETVRIRIQPGTYLIVGVCDEDCSDLDLALVSGGEEVDADDAADDSPVLGIEVSAATTVTLRVHMANCSSEPCRYGVAAFSY